MPQTIILDYMAFVDATITTKTAPNSITPIDEAICHKDLANILDQWTLDFITDAGNTTTNNMFCGNLGVNTTTLGGFALRVSGTTNLIGNTTITTGNLILGDTQEIRWLGANADGILRTGDNGTLDIQGVPASEFTAISNPALGLLRGADFISTDFGNTGINVVGCLFAPKFFGQVSGTGNFTGMRFFPHLGGITGTNFNGQYSVLTLDAEAGNISNNGIYVALNIAMQRPPTAPAGSVWFGLAQGDATVHNLINGPLRLPNLLNFADDSAAAAGGVVIGQLYRTGSIVKVRVT